MFASRRRTTAPHLAWRVRLFLGAAVLALAGMFSGQSLPIWASIALLAVALLLRFAPASDDEPDEDAPLDDPAGDGDTRDLE